MNKNVDKKHIKVIEEALCTWILQRSRRNRNCRGVRQEEVVNIVTYFKSELEISGSFFPTNNWINDFKQRYKLYIITNGRCKIPMPRFQPLEFVLNFGIHPSMIYIADEAGLYWRFKYSSSLEPDYLTFLNCANVTGQHKLRPFVIGKIKDPPSLKGLKPPITYCSQKDGLMSRQLFYKWFTTCFVPEVQEVLYNKRNEMVLLIIDSATYHPQPGDLIAVHPSIKVLYIPLENKAEKNSQIIFNYIKKKYKDEFLNKALSSGNVDYLAQFNVKDMAHLLADCCSSVPESMFNICWKYIISANADCVLTDVPTDENVQSSPLNQLCSQFNLEPSGIQAWYEGVGEDVSRLMTDYEILENAVSIALEGEDEEEPLCVPSAAKVQAQEAFTAFELCLRWAQENGYAASQTAVLREMKAKAFSMKDNEPPLKRIKLEAEDMTTSWDDESDSDSSREVVIFEEI